MTVTVKEITWDELIMKETANERDQRRDHLDDHL